VTLMPQDDRSWFRWAGYSQLPTEEVASDADETRSASETHCACLRHAVAMWVALPATVSVAVLTGLISVTCTAGYPRWFWVVVFIFEVHYLFSERQAWYAVKAVLTQPQQLILRQKGVLKKRRGLFSFGSLVVVQMCIDFTFPFVARGCDDTLTPRWAAAFLEIPCVGQRLSTIIHSLRFWGVAALVALCNILITGIAGIIRMSSAPSGFSEDGGQSEDRLPGALYFEWALTADVAVLPSVAFLCNEIAEDKKYSFKPGDCAGTAAHFREAEAHKVADPMATMMPAFMKKNEQAYREQIASMKLTERGHYLIFTCINIVFGNLLPLWLQASFVALVFETENFWTKLAVIASMTISTYVTVTRLKSVFSYVGPIAAIPAALVVLFLLYIAAKIVFIYQCPSHLWNLSSGCVNEAATLPM